MLKEIISLDNQTIDVGGGGGKLFFIEFFPLINEEGMLHLEYYLCVTPHELLLVDTDYQ